MRFVIAKPEDKMSMGDLFYSVPAKGENDKAFDELVQICLRRADREFPRHPDYTMRRVNMMILLKYYQRWKQQNNK